LGGAGGAYHALGHFAKSLAGAVHGDTQVFRHEADLAGFAVGLGLNYAEHLPLSSGSVGKMRPWSLSRPWRWWRRLVPAVVGL
jgi:hypothetical protein